MPKGIWPKRAALGKLDPEFEAQVRARVGAPFAHAVDASRAFQTPEARIVQSPDGRLGRQKGEYDPNTGTVSGFGLDTDKQTWAHEYRHQYFRFEETNRLADAFFSGSPADWDKSVIGWADWQKRQYGKELNFSQAEADLIEKLEDKGSDKSLDMEKIRYQTDPTTVEKIKAFFETKQKRNAKEKVREPWRIWAEKANGNPLGEIGVLKDTYGLAFDKMMDEFKEDK